MMTFALSCILPGYLAMTTTCPARPQSSERDSQRRPALAGHVRQEPHSAALPSPPRIGIPLGVLLERNPLRPPAWRYLQAMALLDYGAYPGSGDRDLTRIFGLLRRLRHGSGGKPLRAE